MKLVLLKGSITIAATVALSACAAATMNSHKGAVIDPLLASSIQPGVDNKASVEKLLGRPTFAGEFTPNDWYYVSRDVRQIAFRNPSVTKQTALHIRFDPAGNVASVERTGKELVMNVNPTKRSTPTLGRQRSFFEELFGNIGTVGAAGLPGSGPKQ